MDYMEALNKIEKELNNRKIENAKLEERLSQVEKEENQVMEALKEENIEIDNLDNILNELEFNLQEGIEKCQKTLAENSQE